MVGRSAAAQQPRERAATIEATVAHAGDGPADPGGDLTGVTLAGDLFQRRVEGLSWRSVALRTARCSAAVFERVVFDEVVLRDCELSGVAFVECSFRSCVIIGGRATSILSFSDCVLHDLAVVDLRADRVEIHGGTLRSLSIEDTAIDRLSLHQLRPPRRGRGRLRLSEVGLATIGGVTELPATGIDVDVDAGLWLLLGDLTLRRLGVSQLAPPDPDARH